MIQAWFIRRRANRETVDFPLLEHSQFSLDRTIPNDYYQVLILEELFLTFAFVTWPWDSNRSVNRPCLIAVTRLQIDSSFFLFRNFQSPWLSFWFKCLNRCIIVRRLERIAFAAWIFHKSKCVFRFMKFKTQSPFCLPEVENIRVKLKKPTTCVYILVKRCGKVCVKRRVNQNFRLSYASLPGSQGTRVHVIA